MKTILLTLLTLLTFNSFGQVDKLLLLYDDAVTETPITPPELNVEGGANKITLTVNLIGDSIRVYRGTSTNPTAWVYSIAPGATKTDTPLTPGVTYYYRGKTLLNGNLSDYSTTVSDIVDTAWTVLTDFYRTKIDTEIITFQGDRDFEDSESIFNWEGLTVSLSEVVAHFSTYSLTQTSALTEAFSYTLGGSRIISNDSLTVGNVDTVVISFYLYPIDVGLLLVSTEVSLQSPNIGYTLPLILNSWNHYIDTVTFNSVTGIDILINQLQGEGFFVPLELRSMGGAQTDYYLDDVSLIWAFYKAYAKVTDEPTVVKVNEAVLTRSYGTKEYTISGHWDYQSGVLYIGNYATTNVKVLVE